MNHHILLRNLFLVIGILTLGSGHLAHSGNTFIADAVTEGIDIDGDLSDWPETKEYRISIPYIFDGKPDTTDFTGRFRVACDFDHEALYVGVEIADDFIKLQSPDDLWNSRDACEIFLVLDHSSQHSVPLQFVYRQSPIVAEADVPNKTLQNSFEVVRKQTNNKLTYEWRIDLAELPNGKGSAERPSVLGFDVGYIDRDEGEDIAVFSSSPGRSKHLTSQSLGDLMLLANPQVLVTVNGRVERPARSQDKDAQLARQKFAPIAIRHSESSRFYMQVPCNNKGVFEAKIPPGKYTASLVDSLPTPIAEQEPVEFEVKSDETAVTLPDLTMRLLPKPDLVGETGLLRQSEFDTEKVDAFVAAFQEYRRVPGVSLAIIADGRVRYSKKYGVKSTATNSPLEGDTVFEACSLTKPVFAFAVNRLIEKGVIDLETPLYKYKPRVPGYEDVVTDPRYRLITAQHVLAHRTGFPNWRSGKLTIDFEPGKGYGYSGEGFELLGAVVSHVTGKPLVQVIDEEVFHPLGIENAHLVWNERLAECTAQGHTVAMGPVPKSRSHQPGMAYSLHIDADNYAKLLTAILRREGLKKETYDAMLSQQFEPADKHNENEYPYGLGIIVEDTSLGKKYSHGGVNPGWRCRFSIYDDSKLGYVVFTNSDSGDEFGKDLEQFLMTGRPASRPSSADTDQNFVGTEVETSDTAARFAKAKIESVPPGGGKVDLTDVRWRSVSGGTIDIETRDNERVLRLRTAGNGDGVAALLPGSMMGDGEIEVDIASDTFSGIAFRAAGTNSFDMVYFRPQNSGTAKHKNTVQYVCRGKPGGDWRSLRTNFPDKYEAGAAIRKNEWFHVRLVLKGETVTAYVNGGADPVLIVDKMLGERDNGALGIWGWNTLYKNFSFRPDQD